MLPIKQKTAGHNVLSTLRDKLVIVKDVPLNIVRSPILYKIYVDALGNRNVRSKLFIRIIFVRLQLYLKLVKKK